MPGFFSQERGPSAAALRASEHVRLLNPLARFHSVRTAIVHVGSPDLPIYKSPWPALLGPQGADALIRSFSTGDLSADELTLAVFGRTFADLQQECLERERLSYCLTTDAVLERLRNTKTSEIWIESMKTSVPHPTIMEILGYSANGGLPTHAELPGDGWIARDPHRFIFQNAARVGFVAVAFPFGENEDFGIRPGLHAWGGLSGFAHTTSPYSVHPFSALPAPIFTAVRKRIRKLAHELTHMYGQRQSREPGTESGSHDPYEEATYMSAQLGAMVAAVAIDPASCIVFRPGGASMPRSMNHLRPEEYPWLQRDEG